VTNIAVVDGGRVAQAGLLVLLDNAGHDAVALDDGAPVPGETDAVIIDARSDVDHYLACTGATSASVPVVVLTVEPPAESFAELLRRGACAVVPWDTSPEHLLTTVKAAVQGYSLLPTSVAQRMSRDSGAGTAVSGEEAGWLRSLADGVTIAQLASTAGYAERSMYRLLRNLYERLGVNNRHEAIVVATRRGLL